MKKIALVLFTVFLASCEAGKNEVATPPVGLASPPESTAADFLPAGTKIPTVIPSWELNPNSFQNTYVATEDKNGNTTISYTSNRNQTAKPTNKGFLENVAGRGAGQTIYYKVDAYYNGGGKHPLSNRNYYDVYVVGTERRGNQIDFSFRFIPRGGDRFYYRNWQPIFWVRFAHYGSRYIGNNTSHSWGYNLLGLWDQYDDLYNVTRVLTYGEGNDRIAEMFLNLSNLNGIAWDAYYGYARYGHWMDIHQADLSNGKSRMDWWVGNGNIVMNEIDNPRNGW